MRFYHEKTNERISPIELKRRFQNGENFYCNECKKELTEHIGTLAEGIFCDSCRDSIIEEIKQEAGE